MRKKVYLVFLLLWVPLLVFGTTPTLPTLPTIPIGEAVGRLANILYYVLVLLGVIFVIWGGIIIATAGGEPTKIETGKRIVIFALIGVVIGTIAFGLVDLIYTYLTR